MLDTSYHDLKPKVVLAAAAHPDDMDFLASGSLAKWAEQGADVYYLLITDGSKGSDDPSMTSEQLVKTRAEEQRNAAKAIGAKDVIFLNYPDAYLEVTMDLKKDITRVVRKLKPELVLTTDPTFVYNTETGYVNHSDHRAAGQATLDSIFPMARDRLTFPELLKEGLEPHKVNTLLLCSFGNGNYHVDITPTIDKKMAAIAAHASQIKNVQDAQERIKGFAKLVGGKMGVNYGESFTKLDMPG